MIFDCSPDVCRELGNFSYDLLEGPVVSPVVLGYTRCPGIVRIINVGSWVVGR